MHRRLLSTVLIAGFVCHGLSSRAALHSVIKETFGETKDGQPVELITLRNAKGMTVKVITYGAIIYSVEAPDKNGQFTNVTINRPTPRDYENRSAAFGAVLGRYANRIGKAQFRIDGNTYSLTKNNGQNHIHGGSKGFGVRVWKTEALDDKQKDLVSAKLTIQSKDGEEGYPGNLSCAVVYSLNDQNELGLEYTATTDKPTVVNFSNHAYWNMAGAQSGDVLGELLTINADKFLRVDEGLIPTGEMATVEATPLDFRKPHAIGERINQITEKHFNAGYDHCFVLNHKQPGQFEFCAKLADPNSGRVMDVFTTEPGVQIYSANFGSGVFEGFNGYKYPSHCGLALETQHYPDSPNKPEFPSTLLKPGETFRSRTVLRFSVE